MGNKNSRMNEDQVLVMLMRDFANDEACSEIFKGEMEKYYNSNNDMEMWYYEKMSRDQLMIEIRKLLVERKRGRYINETLMRYLEKMTHLIIYAKDMFVIKK